MKKALLVVALAAVFVLALSTVAFAAAPTVWNFEKDFAQIAAPDVVDVAVPAGVYGEGFSNAVTVPAGGTTYSGPVLDNRGRTGRIYAEQYVKSPYSFGAAGSATGYTAATYAAPVLKGIIGDAAWVAANGATRSEEVNNAGAWGKPYYVAGAKTTVGPQPIADDQWYVYLQWWAVEHGNEEALVDVTANTGSPHGGYSTTSIKCVVCHSVHTAAPGGSATLPVADNLLRMNAKDACAYCHVSAGHTVGNPIYGGNVDALGGEMGHALGSNPTCSECHGTVHGANVETIPPLNGKLLTLVTDNGGKLVDRVAAMDTLAASQGFVGPVTGFTAAQYADAAFFATHPEMEDQAVGVFCQGCHDGSYALTIKNASASTLDTDFKAGDFSGHRVMATSAGSDNAYAPADNCVSCHDSYDGFGGQAFPHNWGVAGKDEAIEFELVDGVPEATNQSMAWLLSGAFAGDTKTANGGPIGKTGHAGPNGGTLQDGVCLKCHRGSATTGVGLTY